MSRAGRALGAKFDDRSGFESATLKQQTVHYQVLSADGECRCTVENDLAGRFRAQRDRVLFRTCTRENKMPVRVGAIGQDNRIARLNYAADVGEFRGGVCTVRVGSARKGQCEEYKRENGHLSIHLH